MRTDHHIVDNHDSPAAEIECPDEPEWDEYDDIPEPPVRHEPASSLPEPPHPINWDLLTADQAEAEWRALDEWVNWLRTTYGLPPSIVPPYWHRHPELVWELSALHLHWLGAYDPEQHGSAPYGWHRDFADARNRLREWVALSGTKLNTDRPTQRPIWPGEEDLNEAHAIGDVMGDDRARDFAEFVRLDVARRRETEQRLTSLRQEYGSL